MLPGHAARAGRPPQRMPAADAGAFFAFGGQGVVVAGVGVAPAEIGVQSPGLHGLQLPDSQFFALLGPRDGGVMRGVAASPGRIRSVNGIGPSRSRSCNRRVS